MLASASTLAATPFLARNLPYDPARDFRLVGLDVAILPALNGFARDMAGPGQANPSRTFANNLQPGGSGGSGKGLPWDKIRDFVGDQAKSAAAQCCLSGTGRSPPCRS